VIGRPTWRLLVLLGAVWLASETANAQTWTQFEMNRQDAGGRFLWTTAENWTKGLPDAERCVEIMEM
jgi:hypothetical protein